MESERDDRGEQGARETGGYCVAAPWDMSTVSKENSLKKPVNAPQFERLHAQMVWLRLFKSRERIEALPQEATAADLSYAGLLDGLLAEAVPSEISKDVTMLTSEARFPFVKNLDAFDFGYQPSIDRKQMQTLPRYQFIEHGESVVFLGLPGVGKATPRHRGGSEGPRVRLPRAVHDRGRIDRNLYQGGVGGPARGEAQVRDRPGDHRGRQLITRVGSFRCPRVGRFGCSLTSKLTLGPRQTPLVVPSS